MKYSGKVKVKTGFTVQFNGKEYKANEIIENFESEMPLERDYLEVLEVYNEVEEVLEDEVEEALEDEESSKSKGKKASSKVSK